MQRRKLLQMGLGLLGAGFLPVADARADDDIIGAILEGKQPIAPQVPVIAAPPALRARPTQAALVDPRWVHLHNVHTGEKLEAVYWERGAYVPDAVNALDKVLRDYRNDEVHPMNPGLYDILDQVAKKTGTKGPFQVISGYRSPATNKMLSERSGEVAKHSLHMEGEAMDIFLEDVDLKYVRAAALDLGRGGVGYYPTSNFVHVDVGPVRKWVGA
ncbi:DUF882 domain-containing protein [uncultured Caulobacter sp.]|jgi:uncharacterized protein YcbK (DUF882 family)|uniref:DUF882 domain-containing protein n=1 Tax=uncultured Caulobacter sp. TaxID=158749 RepID=UPI00262B9514|nr:DUF882 domain-containing protein [uncultured Caulobacter sp.]